MSVAHTMCPELVGPTGCTIDKQVGDIVKIGFNADPDYEIVAIAGPTAWVRQPITFMNEALVPLERLRFVSRPGMRLAA